MNSAIKINWKFFFPSQPSFKKPIAQEAIFFIVIISSPDNCRFQNISSSTCAEEYLALLPSNNLPIFKTPDGFPVVAAYSFSDSYFKCSIDVDHCPFTIRYASKHQPSLNPSVVSYSVVVLKSRAIQSHYEPKNIKAKDKV